MLITTSTKATTAKPSTFHHRHLAGSTHSTGHRYQAPGSSRAEYLGLRGSRRSSHRSLSSSIDSRVQRPRTIISYKRKMTTLTLQQSRTMSMDQSDPPSAIHFHRQIQKFFNVSNRSASTWDALDFRVPARFTIKIFIRMAWDDGCGKLIKKQE